MSTPVLTGNLLIVDDSPDDIALLVEYFRSTCLRLAVALDGREGYQKAMVIHPDLILMDVRMPRADGFAALRLLKSDVRTRDIPVIFLSGSNELEDRLNALNLGAVDYIGKPFSPEEVLARVRIHLGIRRQLKGLSAGSDEGVAATVDANPVVIAAMNVLGADLGRAIPLPELARQVGTNERRLTELFREATGMSVFAWLREERFRMACRLLEESELDIQQIAIHIGYGSAGNFATWFRDRLGVTPRDYRQAKRAGVA